MDHGRLHDLLATTRLIHEAALDDQVWPDALAALARLFGGLTASLMVWTPSGVDDLLLTHNIDEAVLDTYRQHYGAIDPFNTTQHQRAPRSIHITQEVIPDEVFTRTEFYADFWRKVGIHYAIGGDVERTERSLVMAGVHRAAGGPPYEAIDLRLFNGVADQLRVALRQRRLLGVQGAAAAALDALALAVILTDGLGRVVWANLAAEALLRAGDGLIVRAGCLACNGHGDTQRLAGLVRRAAAPGRPAAEAGLPVARADGAAPLRVLVTPLVPRAARRLGAREEARVLVATRPGGEVPPAPQLLRELYGLTPAEARLAVALLDGRTLEEHAAAAGITRETARGYLKRVFAATGTRRQSELVLLLGRGPGALRVRR
ncbi:MAG: hypothetical protein U1E17_01690 [Geminicoccaceae bacterium]